MEKMNGKMNENMKELTKAEEQVMQVLWDLKAGFVKDILDKMPEPKPAYNTVSTIVRILEKKGFVGYKAFGKTHEYYPLINKDDYRSFSLRILMKGYFGGSIERLVSFFAKDNEMDVKEVEKLLKYVQKDLKENEK
jgi:BlaI family transcriptional regulator, penicillinase repressor